jgi:hypothetical protein
MFWFLSPTIQNPKWVGLVALGCAFALWGAGAQAQQPTKVARIRVLGATSASANTARVEAFQLGLRELGYVEGKNIIIENRWAEGKTERLPDLAAGLVQLKVDVIISVDHQQPPDKPFICILHHSAICINISLSPLSSWRADCRARCGRHFEIVADHFDVVQHFFEIAGDSDLPTDASSPDPHIGGA